MKISKAHQGKTCSKEKKEKKILNYTRIVSLLESVKDFSEGLGLNGANIVFCCKGKLNTVGGYILRTWMKYKVKK